MLHGCVCKRRVWVFNIPNNIGRGIQDWRRIVIKEWEHLNLDFQMVQASGCDGGWGQGMSSRLADSCQDDGLSGVRVVVTMEDPRLHKCVTVMKGYDTNIFRRPIC